MSLKLLIPALPLNLSLLIAQVAAQSAFPSVSVPSTCTEGLTAGTDTVLLTVPYPPSAVVGIVSDFQNLTWSGNAPDTITLNGTDNEVGTARMYSLQGLTVVETLDTYYKPELTCGGFAAAPAPGYTPDVVYAEAHSTAQIDYQGNQVYMPFDGITLTATCAGFATQLNYTTGFCATDAPSAQTLLHSLHQQDLQNVQAELGNSTYTSCENLIGGSC